MDLADIKLAGAFAIAYKLEGRQRLTLFSDEQLLRLGKGKCGPGDGLGDWATPETMYGLWVGPA